MQCKYIRQTLLSIAQFNPDLAEKIDQQGGFLLETDIEPLIRVNPNQHVLIRTSQTRYLLRASEVKEKVDAIEKEYQEIERTKGSPAVMHGADYVRDVSIPASAIFNG